MALPRWFRALPTIGLALAALLAPTAFATASGSQAPKAHTKFHPGSAGVGDPYFPQEGNGGYDVGHYTLDLSYHPKVKRLGGIARIQARATTNLSRFDLDLKGMQVTAVRVDGKPATFTRNGQELMITPRFGLPEGMPFTVAVHYRGKPNTIAGSPLVFGSPYGWIYTKDGVFVGNEPNAASTWYPCNDHPSDKASFTFNITAPTDRRVVANGQLVAHHERGHQATYVWNETRPMATYLSTIDIGNWDVEHGHTPDGIPQTVAADPSLAQQSGDVFDKTGAITDYWHDVFGPYPFRSTGAIVDNVPKVGFSLETQTRPIYGQVPRQGTMAHELAHEWYGDSVSVATWQNIWLNEGFATFASRLWHEHTGGASTWEWFQQTYNTIPASADFWNLAVAEPGRASIFTAPVYTRGAMTLAALRHKIGDEDFFKLLQTWASAHRHGNATTTEFISMAEKVSGQGLDHFFRVWLRQTHKPQSW